VQSRPGHLLSRASPCRRLFARGPAPVQFRAFARISRDCRTTSHRVEQEIKRKVEWVFHRQGQAIKCYYGAWRSACKRAGVTDRKVHDFRRTAVDRLEWSGVPRVVAMKLTGHETDAIYSRYHIARGKDLRAGVARVADYVEALNDSVQESGKEPATTIRAQKGASRK